MTHFVEVAGTVQSTLSLAGTVYGWVNPLTGNYSLDFSEDENSFYLGWW